MSEQHSDERSEKRNVVSHLPDAPLMTVADAEQIVAHLVEARAALADKLAEYGEAVKRLAYQAHALHDTEASRELSDARESLRDLERQIGEHHAAITQERSEVAAAQAREARAADAEMALELKAEVEEFRRLGAVMDELLLGLADTAMELRDNSNRVHALGSDFPSHSQLQLGELALRSSIMRTPWAKTVQMVPPGQRHGFRELIGRWYANIERNSIAPRLAADNEAHNGEVVDAA